MIKEKNEGHKMLSCGGSIFDVLFEPLSVFVPCASQLDLDDPKTAKTVAPFPASLPPSNALSSYSPCIAAALAAVD